MINPHSDDPDVAAAAKQALDIIHETLDGLPKADRYDYGGHELQLGEYQVCTVCARPIAEAQAAAHALKQKADTIADETVKEHLQLAADFFRLEAETAVLRAELHNGNATEGIIDRLLGFQFERGIHDDYQHSHHGGQA